MLCTDPIPVHARHLPIGLLRLLSLMVRYSFANDDHILQSQTGYKATMGTLDSAAEHLPTDGPVIIVTASYEGKKF